jgi:hypothetical protein
MGRVMVVSGSLFLLLLSAPAGAQCPGEGNPLFEDLSNVVEAGLYDARNAHRTNTKEQFEEALEGGFDWFEGDVRAEINHRDRLEMRHDEIHESGDNLTLREWLEQGKKAGKGLKLDVKETELMEQLLDTVEDVDPPQDKLMFNLGDSGMDRWGAEIRRRFPDAILAINPRGGEGRIDAARVDRMIELATRFGGPVTFVLHEGQVSPEAVARLQEHGPVSIWGDVSDAEKRRRELRAAGVEGMIDLGHAGGVTPGAVADRVKNQVRTWIDGL